MPFLSRSFLFAMLAVMMSDLCQSCLAMLAVMLSDLCHSCLAMLGKAVADLSSDSDGASDLPEDIYIKAFLSPFTPAELESTPHVLVTEQDSTPAVESNTECTAELPPDSKHGPWEQDSAADKFFLGVGISCP